MVPIDPRARARFAPREQSKAPRVRVGANDERGFAEERAAACEGAVADCDDAVLSSFTFVGPFP